MPLQAPIEAFRLLAHLRDYIVYGTAPRDGQPGKLDKFPIDVATGLKLPKWNDPAAGVTMGLDQAFGYAAKYPLLWGIGVIIRAGSNLHFLDIDGCRVNGHWSPVALELLGKFSGAFIEKSTSGNGLHIIFHAVGLPQVGLCLQRAAARVLFEQPLLRARLWMHLP